MKVKYTNPLILTEETWRYAPYKKKKELLKTLGVNQSWAKTKSIKEMVSRGGGIPARMLLDLNKKYLNLKGGLVIIDWK